MLRRRYHPEEKIRIVLEGFSSEAAVNDVAAGDHVCYYGIETIMGLPIGIKSASMGAKEPEV